MQKEPHKFDPHEVDQGTMYYKMHWGAVYGHKRGIIRGLIVGCALGAFIGGAIALMAASPIAGAFALNALTASTGTIMAAFATFGGVLASGIMGRIGNAAGNVAAQLAEMELRERYPELPDIGPESPEPGMGHHYEVPAHRDKGKLFIPRIGFAGALLGGAFGALASAAGLGGLLSLHIAGAAAFPIPIALGALVGSSFGVHMARFKSVFNVTDNLLSGSISGPDERERQKLLEKDGPPAVITSLQRQEEYYRLKNGYFQKAFEAGFAGNARGLIGGLVSGGILGAVIGGLSVLALGATGIGGGVLFAGVLAFIMKKSVDFFTEAGFEASGHSHVHEVHHERIRAIRKGVDLSFEQAEANIVKRRQADPDMTPPDAQQKSFFNPKVALMMTGIGAIVGLGLAPLANGVSGVLLGAGTHLAPMTGAAVFGAVGSVFGIGPAITERLHALADRIYYGTFTPGNAHPDIKVEGKIPLMSPRSELAQHFSHHLQKAQEPAMAVSHQADYAPPPRATTQAQSILERGSRNFTQHAQQPLVNDGVQR